MENDTLDEADRAVLAAIGDGRVSEETIESRLDPPLDDLADRLAVLRENALVRPAGADGWELTENGVRALNASGTGGLDERIDTPADAEVAIESLELSTDERDAVRKAFSFLRFWGDATSAEVVDGVYGEAPAGYEDADEWWTDCVGRRLTSLPRVEGTVDAGPAAWWEYGGPAAVERSAGRDGRAVLDDDASARSGSVRHGLEEAATDGEERRAARAAFAVLYDRGSGTSAALVEAANHLQNDEATVDPGVEHGAPDGSLVVEHPSGFESGDAWATRLAEIFEVVPGIERESCAGSTDEVVWSYRPEPDAEVPT